MVQVDDTRQQTQISSSSKRTWESVGKENAQKDYNTSLANTNRLPTSSNKLIDVLKPPTTALTPHLPTGTYSSGYSTVTKPKTTKPSSSSGGSSGGSSYPMTTISTPTPSAETLTGTA